MKKIIPLLLFLVLPAAGVGTPASAWAALGEKKLRVLARGNQGFRQMLHNARLRPLHQIQDLDASPHRTIVVIFGDLGVLAQIRLEEFLKKGGAVLVASDRPDKSEALWKLGARATGKYIVCRDPHKNGYLQHPYCPYMRAFSPRNHPLFRGVDRLATNSPSALQLNIDPKKLSGLAFFDAKEVTEEERFGLKKIIILDGNSVMMKADRSERIRRRLPPAHLPFAMAREGLPGKLLILAGHGIFLNMTMFHAENVAFTRNCLDWLAQGGEGQPPRDQVLFIEEGRIIDTFKVDLKQFPPLPLPTTAQVNRLVRGLEEENFFNRLLFALVGRGAEPGQEPALARERIVRVAVVLLSLLLALLGLRRLWKARHKIDEKTPLVSRGVVLETAGGPLVEQRRQDLLEQGNFWETARQLAQQCFAEYALHATVQPPPRPEIAVQGGRWQRRRLNRRVRELWQVAYEGIPRPLSAAQLIRLKSQVEETHSALTAGILVLRVPLSVRRLASSSAAP